MRRRGISRRSFFFLGVAAVGLVLIPATPPEFRWVNLFIAALAVFWAIIIAVEDLAGRRGGLRENRSASD